MAYWDARSTDTLADRRLQSAHLQHHRIHLMGERNKGIAVLGDGTPTDDPGPGIVDPKNGLPCFFKDDIELGKSLPQ